MTENGALASRLRFTNGLLPAGPRPPGDRPPQEPALPAEVESSQDGRGTAAAATVDTVDTCCDPRAGGWLGRGGARTGPGTRETARPPGARLEPAWRRPRRIAGGNAACPQEEAAEPEPGLRAACLAPKSSSFTLLTCVVESAQGPSAVS